MGSYLSVVNNTPDTWQCKIGPDEAALKISAMVVGAVGALATVVATAGAAAPLAAALTGNGVVAVFGVSTSALATVTAGAAAASTVASVVGGASGFGLGVAKLLSDQLVESGYTTIAPGQSHKSHKMTLSLWQQASCIKTVLVDEKTVRVETMNMRPIFTGATDGSNMNHNLQWWLDNWETEKQEIVAKDGKMPSRELQMQPELELPPFDIAAANATQVTAI